MSFEGFQIETDLSEFDEAAQEAVHKYLRDIGVELANQLQQEAPVGATGDLQQSFQLPQAILDEGTSRIIVGSRLPYAKPVQTGTGPHIADFEALQVWARRKLGNEAAAGPVWMSIAKHGTEANPYMERAIENTIQRFRA